MAARVDGSNEDLGRGRLALLFVPYQMVAETPRNVLLFAFSKLLFDLIQGEVHHIVMMQFLRPDEVAEPQPKLMD